MAGCTFPGGRLCLQGKRLAAGLLVTLSVTPTTWLGGSVQSGSIRQPPALLDPEQQGAWACLGFLILARGLLLPALVPGPGTPPGRPASLATRPRAHADPLCLSSLQSVTWLEPWWPSSKTP